jgi:hypothetical protein
MAFLKPGHGRLVLLLAAALAAGGSVRGQRVTEQDVKAVFLYKFTNFVEWPATAAPSPDAFRICIVANKEMTAVIERTMQGESVNGRRVETIAPASPSAARNCHMLFVGHGEMPRAEPLLAAVRDLPVLTVGESEDFLAKGGAIGFVLDDNRVRFDINVENARRGGLSVSSRLLQVAHRLEGISR